MSAVASLLWTRTAACVTAPHQAGLKAHARRLTLFGAQRAGRPPFHKNVHKTPAGFHSNVHRTPASWSAILSAWDIKRNGTGKGFLIIVNNAGSGKIGRATGSRHAKARRNFDADNAAVLRPRLRPLPEVSRPSALVGAIVRGRPVRPAPTTAWPSPRDLAGQR